MTTNPPTATTKTWLRRGLLALSAAAVLVAGAAPAATAAATPTPPPPGAGLDVWKTAVVARIDLRLATLSALKLAVNGATNLTGGDRSTLSTLVAADASGLGTLKTKTNAETTIAAVKDDARSMIQDYRVYLLVVPKVRFAIAGDTEATVITNLRDVHDKLASVAAQLAAQGKDTSTETAQLADMSGKLDAARSALDGQVANLLAIQPGPNGTAIHAAVLTVRGAIRGARDDIAAAVALAKQVRQELKALGG